MIPREDNQPASQQAIDLVAQQTFPGSPLECHADTHADHAIATDRFLRYSRLAPRKAHS